MFTNDLLAVCRFLVPFTFKLSWLVSPQSDYKIFVSKQHFVVGNYHVVVFVYIDTLTRFVIILLYVHS